MEIAFFTIIILLILLHKKQFQLPQINSNAIKWILAILIVLQHSALEYDGAKHLLWFQNLGTWICSMFFFISGYGLFSQELKIQKMSFICFFKKRINKILRPFLIAIIGYQILIIIKGSFDIGLLINYLKKGDTNLLLPYCWFVFALIFLYYLTYIAIKFKRNHWFIFIIITIYVIFVRNVLHWGPWWYTSIYGYWLGVVCQKNYLISINNIKSWRIYSIISLSLIVLFLYGHPKSLLNIITPPVTGLTILYGICNLFTPPIYKKISFLSKISYEIYLVQGYSTIIIFKNFNGPIILYLALIYITTIILSYICFFINKQIS